MAIKQVSTANTFGEWLTATQSLVTHYNDFDDTANLVFLTANNTSQVYSDTQNVYSNTVIVYNNAVSDTQNVYSNTVIVYNNTEQVYTDTQNVYSNTVTVYNDIQTYVGVAYDAANAAYTVANTANDTANLANTTANEVLATLQSGSIVLDVLDDTTTNDDANYITFINSAALSGGNSANLIVSSTKLYYNPSTGTLNSTNYNALSDVRLKNSIITIDGSVDTIQKLNGVEFIWNETGKKSYGVIAQEIENILPELVEGDEQKSVNYIGLIAFLINAVKELDDRLKKLEK